MNLNVHTKRLLEKLLNAINLEVPQPENSTPGFTEKSDKNASSSNPVHDVI